MIVSLILAMDEKGGIGKNNRLPWHLPSDLRRFKHITMGHHLIMGRKTYETIGKPLPGRVMIVVTHQKDYFPIGCMTVHSINAAIKLAKKKHETEVFIIGGGEIFNQALDLADKIYLTTVHADIEADIYFTEINKSLWTIMKSEETTLDENDEYTTDFQVLVRNYEKQG